ncbi:PREDICTED: uncharacterized protein LOC105316169, partial [Amphimedon queenslandica]|uniref:Core-binding (CB) domain-containing protein n=1 Tax=Amphimedon queenslandica TaxID=400682 RepID=A0AAN0IU23_AMPQE
LSSAVELATRLGLPVEPSKVEGPSTTLTFLGIEIDTVSRELRLPRDKLLRLKGIIEEWRVKATKKSSVTKHQLDVLVGLLSDAAQVVPAGRPFIRQLIDAKSELKRASHFTRLSPGCKADIFWWSAFMEEWNGTGLFPTRTIGPVITADASGSWGCGAFLEGPCFWFQVQWPSEWSQVNIAAKELFPLVVAIAIWGPQCKDSQICLNSDNQAVVSALATRSAKDPFLSHLLRSLFFFLAHYNISYRAQHIAGSQIPLSNPRLAAVNAPRHQATVDLHTLEGAVQGFFRKGLADSSASSYATAQRRFLSFCAECNITPLPLSEHTLCLFAAFLANQGLQARTIQAYLSAL